MKSTLDSSSRQEDMIFAFVYSWNTWKVWQNVYFQVTLFELLRAYNYLTCLINVHNICHLFRWSLSIHDQINNSLARSDFHRGSALHSLPLLPVKKLRVGNVFTRVCLSTGMYPHMYLGRQCVYPSMHLSRGLWTGCVWMGAYGRGGVHPRPPHNSPQDGHWSGRYTFYSNAFLLIINIYTHEISCNVELFFVCDNYA